MSQNNPKKYDFLIVGAGVFGSVFAREMTDKGKKCVVIDKNQHIAGHCFTENIEGICVHKYGPHIFHTNDLEIWKYVQKFASFNQYHHRVKASYRNQIYSFPINLMTLYQLWGVTNPLEAKIELEKRKIPCTSPQNLEEWALSQVGQQIYEIFIKGYTIKQWGCDPKNLQPNIIKRLPIRLSFEDSYYNDSYQGIPLGGYTPLFANILKGIEVRLGEDYFSQRKEWDRLAQKVVYTGKIDEFFDYKYGELEYRSLRFDTKVLPNADFQGTAVMNYPDLSVPFTRITEYKHFELKESDHTVISIEYPENWNRDKIPFYPLNSYKTDQIYKKYEDEARKMPDVIFGGRLAEFKYFDMHQVIASALEKVKMILNR